MDFEKNITELRKMVPFKNTLNIDDIVIFVLPDMSVYGVVKKIERDNSKKIDWWHVTFTILTIPIQRYTLTLRTEQMTGQETFTIDGKYHFFSAIDINTEDDKELKVISKNKPKVTKRKLTLVKKE
jgi:hypothetical protein